MLRGGLAHRRDEPGFAQRQRQRGRPRGRQRPGLDAAEVSLRVGQRNHRQERVRRRRTRREVLLDQEIERVPAPAGDPRDGVQRGGGRGRGRRAGARRGEGGESGAGHGDRESGLGEATFVVQRRPPAGAVRQLREAERLRAAGEGGGAGAESRDHLQQSHEQPQVGDEAEGR